MIRTVTATRYITPFRQGGSVPALVVQMSPVHGGLCADPQQALNDLFVRMVA